MQTVEEIREKLITDINKNYGYEIILRDNEKTMVQKIPTGIFSIDYETRGGFPRGRGVILVGEESTFKSTLMYSAAGNFQKICGNCMSGQISEVNLRPIKVKIEPSEYLSFDKTTKKYKSKIFIADKQGRNLYSPNEFVNAVTEFSAYQYDIACSICNEPTYSLFGLIDSEHNYTRKWARKFGVKNYYVVIAQPEYTEQVGEILREWMSTGKVSFVGIDSVDALGPAVENSSSFEDQQMGVQARTWNKITRAIHSKLNKPFRYEYTNHANVKIVEEKRPEPCITLISQYREKIGAYGNPLIDGGGRGKKFLSSTSIELRKGEREYELIDKKKAFMKFQKYNFELVKNKVGTPHRLGTIYFDLVKLVVNNIASITDYAIREGIVEQKGAWYYYKTMKVQGKENFILKLANDTAALTELTLAVIKETDD